MNLSDIQKEAIEKFDKEFPCGIEFPDGGQNESGEIKKFLSESIRSSILAAFEAVEVEDEKITIVIFGVGDISEGFNQANARRREKQKEFLNL